MGVGLPRKETIIPGAKPPEFGLRTLELVTMSYSVAQVAKGLRISDGTLRRWLEIDAVGSGRVGGVTSTYERELIEPRRKTGVLEMENEVLKRASASSARESILPN